MKGSTTELDFIYKGVNIQNLLLSDITVEPSKFDDFKVHILSKHKQINIQDLLLKDIK